MVFRAQLMNVLFSGSSVTASARMPGRIVVLYCPCSALTARILSVAWQASPSDHPHERNAFIGRVLAYECAEFETKAGRLQRPGRSNPVVSMSHNTFGHLFRVTTWGESHGPALGCVVDGCPPGIRFTLRRHPGLARQAPARPVALRHPAPRGRPGQGPLRRHARRRRRDDDHHRHADLDADRERRPALEGLWRDRPAVPPGPCRLHL